MSGRYAECAEVMKQPDPSVKGTRVKRACQSCGATFLALIGQVNKGAAKYCSQDCVHASRRTGIRDEHGKLSPEYAAWTSIIDRCANPNNKSFDRYGGRGISMHPAWRHDFKAFIEHIGPRPSPLHSVDRIRNNEGYAPGNVRWATRWQQALNTRHNVRLTANGKTQTVAEWSREIGIGPSTIRYRIIHGWNHGDAVSIPPDCAANRGRGARGR